MIDKTTVQKSDPPMGKTTLTRSLERKLLVQRLFRQHYSEMIHLARTLLYTDEEAEDVVQDVFVRLMEIDILPMAEKTRAYLLTAVRNGCMNRIKQKSVTEQVKNLYSVETDTDSHNTAEHLATIDAIHDYAERHLKEPHRTIFRLRFEEDLKLKDIAQRLNMNLKTVFKYLSQSIQSVQNHFRN